jgi:branched-chain amino acid transport system substrate-binding protein
MTPFQHARRFLLVAPFVAVPLTAARADEPAVKIGVLTDMSGAYADAAGEGSVVAARLAVEDAGGSLFGKPIEIVSADHQNKPEVGATIARRWYEREGVDMITDLTNSAVAIAVQNLSREKHKIDLVTSTATTALTNADCSPWGVHWTFDAYALSVGTAGALVEQGAKSWYFITADYTFGANLEATATREILAAGGKVLGHSLAPLNTTDFSSQLIDARASGADVVGLANSGADTANSVKQANEFGLRQRQKLAAFLPFITDIRSMGLEDAQGLILTTAFYWDKDDATRRFAQRFFARHQAMPTMIQAGTYSAVLHYLAAVKAVGTTEADAVMKRMRATPVEDAIFHDGRIRPDGQMVHEMYLVQVKSPAESSRDWDFYKILRTIPGDKAFQPLAESKCKLGQANG